MNQIDFKSTSKQKLITYFIKKFEAIPEERWTVKALRKKATKIKWIKNLKRFFLI